jgi:lipopolysaccharide export LptBFGC system permease protein LptF
MSVILVFVVFVIIGDSIAVAIASYVERFSEMASLLVFFALFIFVFWIAWKQAVRITERYLLRQN